MDFYSGLIYEALRIPTDMFTVIFAIPRTSGWVSQWMEMMLDPEQKIARPRQIYTGPRDVDYKPIEKREGPEKITGPPARRPEAAPPRRLAPGGGRRWRVTVAPRLGGRRRASSTPSTRRSSSPRARVDAVLRRGQARAGQRLREFTPDVRVQARIEISAARFLRGRGRRAST